MNKVKHPVTDVGWRQLCDKVRGFHPNLPPLSDVKYWAEQISEWTRGSYSKEKCLAVAKAVAYL